MIYRHTTADREAAQQRKKPQPFWTGAFLIPLAPGQGIRYILMCKQQNVGIVYHFCNTPYNLFLLTRQPDALRVFWSRLRLPVKKVTKTPKRVDNGPTPDCHDQHDSNKVMCRERQVPASNSYAGKVGFLWPEVKNV